MEKSFHTEAYKVFLNLLREVRVERGITQVDLAERLNETQSFISKCERGERRLDYLELREWCRALGMPVVEFLAGLEGELAMVLRKEVPRGGANRGRHHAKSKDLKTATSRTRPR